MPAGTGYVLTATAPPGTSVSAPLTFSVPPDSEEPIEDQDFVVMADPVGSAAGRITDEEGAPLSGLLVTVTGPGGATYAVRTDVDGGWSLADLPPGDYTATVTPPDGGDVVGADALDFTILAAGGSVGALDFVIALPPPAPTYPARGTVQDEYDDPLADVEVTVRDPDGTPFATVTTDDEGAWRVPGLPVADGWTAEVTVPDGYRPLGPSRLSFDVVSGEVAGLDFALAVVVTATPTPTSPSPTLLDPTSTALPPTPDVPDQPSAGPGDLADTGGPSGLAGAAGPGAGGGRRHHGVALGRPRPPARRIGATGRTGASAGVAQSVL